MIIGKKLLTFKTIDSTNDEARRQIKQGAGEGLIIVAEEQTKGRGKPGSVWQSPKRNLYFTAVLKPRINPSELAPITLMAALAVRSMITKLSGLPVVIKWPNDLLIHGQKVGGILTERLAAGYLIIGIGVNLNVVPKVVRQTSTSLKQLKHKTFSVKKSSLLLATELEREYLAYLARV